MEQLFCHLHERAKTIKILKAISFILHPSALINKMIFTFGKGHGISDPMSPGYEHNIQAAVDFIEARLNLRMKTKDVARASAYSLFHFHRVFRTVTGMTMNHYIRARRMTEAARTLVETETKIIDIALDHGFESQESFTRAFKHYFGTTPWKYRSEQMHYPSRYRNSLTIAQLRLRNKGGRMRPEMKKLPAFKIVGLRYFGSNANNEIPDLWHQFFQRTRQIQNITNAHHFYGVCSSPESDEQGAEFEYIAGAPVSSVDDLPDDMVIREIKAARYAVFTHTGPLTTLRDTYDHIYGQWAPESGEQLIGTYDIEFYNEDFDPQGSEGSRLYICIPIE